VAIRRKKNFFYRLQRAKKRAAEIKDFNAWRKRGVDRTGNNMAGINYVFHMNEEHRVGKRGFNKSIK
jgi:hypothetical protein